MTIKIKNLKKAGSRIKLAVKNNERIILYGDSDLDGASSVVILKETIETLGGKNIRAYFPNREKEGYGLNQKALKSFKKESPALLILMDCGIANFNEIVQAREIGIDVIVIDHHEILDKVPEANIVIDPKQSGDNYPFKGFSTGSLCFKLAESIFGKKILPHLKSNFLELAALSIISDMMPQEEDNKDILEAGLENLPKTARPFLKSFQEFIHKERNGTGLKAQSIKEIANIIISSLNAGVTNSKNIHEAYLSLVSLDKKTADTFVEMLAYQNKQKHMRTQDITREVEMLAEKRKGDIIIFEGRDSWEGVLLGAVASRICNKFQKPVFIFKQKEKDSIGSVRTPKGVNGVEAMKSCSELLITFGGHPMAGGFSVKNKNLDKFKSCLINYFEKHKT